MWGGNEENGLNMCEIEGRSDRERESQSRQPGKFFVCFLAIHLKNLSTLFKPDKDGAQYAIVREREKEREEGEAHALCD